MENRRDYFAGLALQALIAKTPLFDNKGELGIKKPDEELQYIKKQIAKSAWTYADWMLVIDNERRQMPQERITKS